MFFISNAYAQEAANAVANATGGEPNPLLNMLPLVLIFAVFYLFLIRPQQKKLKEHQSLVNSVKKGDEVITGGGIIAKVTKVEEGSNIVHVEISDGVVVKINKATIVDISTNKKEETKKTEASEKSAKSNKKKAA